MLAEARTPRYGAHDEWTNCRLVENNKLPFGGARACTATTFRTGIPKIGASCDDKSRGGLPYSRRFLRYLTPFVSSCDARLFSRFFPIVSSSHWLWHNAAWNSYRPSELLLIIYCKVYTGSTQEVDAAVCSSSSPGSRTPFLDRYQIRFQARSTLNQRCTSVLFPFHYYFIAHSSFKIIIQTFTMSLRLNRLESCSSWKKIN